MARMLRERLLYVCALVFAVFQLIAPTWLDLYDLPLRSWHVMMAVAVILLAVPFLGRKSSLLALAFDLGAIAITVLSCIVILNNWESILYGTYSPTITDYILGSALTLIVLDAARRGAGEAIPFFVLGIFIYVFLGPYMPGMWAHAGLPLGYVLEQIFLSDQGIYGSLTGSSATFLTMFLILGALLGVTGGGQTFMDIAMLTAGRFDGGPGKVAVVSSALFGMLSGSAVANVAVTGNYTIPLMNKLGYKPDFAGGVESMSSSGGGITPPVMGVAAFIMADLLGIPYIHLIGYALFPCLLFYIGILAGVHFEAKKLNLRGVPVSELPKAREVLTWARLVPLLAPIGILLYLLLTGVNLTMAGFYACAAVAVLYLLADLHPVRMLGRARELVGGLIDGAKSAARIAPVMVAVGIFSALLGMTGVAPKISSLILGLGAGNIAASLAVAAIIPLLLGAPLPVTATYILSAALIAPAMVQIGLDPVASHLFLLYYATLASVTPPTCTACVVAANISGGNWLKTAFEGMRLGVVAFLIPFFFVINPALIGRSSVLNVAFSFGTAVVGTILIAASLFGYLNSRLNILYRVVIGIAGLLMLYPNLMASAVGIGLTLVVVLISYAQKGQAPGRAA
jgi:TRAP transporter 4TM/12TM fusion protein